MALIDSIAGMSQSIAKTTQDVQGSLGFIKEWLQTITLLGQDIGIILLYLLYIILFLKIPTLLYSGFKSYTRNNKLLAGILFVKVKKDGKTKKKTTSFLGSIPKLLTK